MHRQRQHRLRLGLGDGAPRLDEGRRLSRWLFAMLHSWDWLPLLERRELPKRVYDDPAASLVALGQFEHLVKMHLRRVVAFDTRCPAADDGFTDDEIPF